MAILSVELIVFVATTYLCLKFKKRSNNLFFPPSGVTVFIPPQEDDLKAIRDYKAASLKNNAKSKKHSLTSVNLLPLGQLNLMTFCTRKKHSCLSRS